MVGPLVERSKLLRQTDGERFVVENAEHNFANEFEL